MKDGPSSFPLRLPRSIREQAVESAQNEGQSLNQFITLAVTEKIVRLELQHMGTK
jgi:predicted HicB family RNase H-like nuclease